MKEGCVFDIDYKYDFLIREVNYYKKNILIEYRKFDSNELLGYLKGVVIHALDIYNELQTDEVIKIFQMEDLEEQQEIQNFYIHVLSKRDCQDNAFYITEFFLEKTFRGNGLGATIIKDLPLCLKKNLEEDISCLYLLPGPLERINGNVKYIYNSTSFKTILLKEKLVKFYSSLGFQQIKNTLFFKESI